jgi:amphi-Trp domain-containing protein
MSKSDKSDKKEIHFEKEMKTAEVISYLEALIKSLKEGKVVIEQGGQFVSLTPGEIIDFEMEARQKSDKERLSLEFNWCGKSIETEPEALKISSEEPAPAVSENEE